MHHPNFWKDHPQRKGNAIHRSRSNLCTFNGYYIIFNNKPNQWVNLLQTQGRNIFPSYFASIYFLSLDGEFRILFIPTSSLGRSSGIKPTTQRGKQKQCTCLFVWGRNVPRLQKGGKTEETGKTRIRRVTLRCGLFKPFVILCREHGNEIRRNVKAEKNDFLVIFHLLFVTLSSQFIIRMRCDHD